LALVDVSPLLRAEVVASPTWVGAVEAVGRRDVSLEGRAAFQGGLVVDLVRETATILAEHKLIDDDSGPFGPNGAYGWRCTCGHFLLMMSDEDEDEALWREHVASVLASRWEQVPNAEVRHRGKSVPVWIRRVPQQPEAEEQP
jgi:hypothetical protein